MIVICCGMPRSGSTWQSKVAYQILGKCGAVTTAGFFNTGPDVRTYLEASAPRDGSVLLKTHRWHECYRELAQKPDVKLLYTYRDIRDVVFSYMHFKSLSFEKAIIQREHLGKFLVHDSLGWMSLTSILIQRYEDIIADNAASIADIARYLGKPLDDGVISQICADNSIDANKRRIASLPVGSRGGWKLDEMDKGLHWNHIRSGKNGSWREQATPRQIVAMGILYNQWLVSNGYEADASWSFEALRELFKANTSGGQPPPKSRWLGFLGNGKKLLSSLRNMCLPQGHLQNAALDETVNTR